MKKSKILLIVLIITISFGCQKENSIKNRIQPWPENPFYWQYNNVPVLLLGGSNDDNLFQWPEEQLIPHLDSMKETGANYVRNTMSSRVDKGFELQAFKKLPNGKYDLNLWNDEYWNRFENFLKWTAQRNIIVQIEVWDRFDYTDYKNTLKWITCPYNPANNINYKTKESGLRETYPDYHPTKDKQPFFHTIPVMNDNIVVRQFQEAFVDKMLSYSLSFGNVLYCMDNETSTNPVWGQYWMKYIRNRAAEAGVNVYVTDMFDKGWNLDTDKKFLISFDRFDLYTFLDISQNTANQNTFKKQWHNILFVRDRVKDNPRPINNTKNYGSSRRPPNNNYYKSTWKRWTTESAVQRYVLNVIGGCASTRFHRPPSGLGLSQPARICIKTLRELESYVKMWELTPGNDLLSEYEEAKVFLTADPGRLYVLFFLQGGSATLNLIGCEGNFNLNWFNPLTGQSRKAETLIGGNKETISTPDDGSWILSIVSLKK
ncbi:hypothetical protein MNBD_BACTEROID01-2117 [hydrothermal vent metagenome]|uniref:DUF6298 domain-containing protein n=1 Tax=hydrothermal vent metagenome TaxID=652676 RepID=A0A3B0U0S2_9ZZZZ